MKLSYKTGFKVSIFLLMYYIYMNSMKRIMIPLSSVTIPLIFLFVLALTLKSSDLKIKTGYLSDKLQCYSWLFIAVLITVNNESLFHNLYKGGMIQMYVMISFFLMATKTTNWIKSWIKWTIFFTMIHTIATIVFYFSPSLYNIYTHLFFSGDALSRALGNYRKGYMCGLTDHPSSNGMILGIGLIIVLEQYLYKRLSYKKPIEKYFYLICVILNVYALFLSGKRSQLIASILAIVIVYIISANKNVGKRLITLAIACIVFYCLYSFLLTRIPGLSIIAAKFARLENSDAGLLNGRQGLWTRAIELFKSNPIFGAGYGSYAAYASVTDAITTSAHNYYLQVAAELGVIGLILYVMAFVSGIISTLKQLKFIVGKQKANDIRILYLCAALAVEIFVLIYSMTSTALMYYPILIPYFIACTVARALRFIKVEELHE